MKRPASSQRVSNGPGEGNSKGTIDFRKEKKRLNKRRRVELDLEKHVKWVLSPTRKAWYKGIRTARKGTGDHQKEKNSCMSQSSSRS